MKIFIALISGLIFGIGLIISGMSNPAKVIGFLDIAGNWDPSLALVMAGAILVALPAFQFAKRQDTSLSGETISLPTDSTINKPLALGAIAFGIGWGLSGYCPGPALVSILIGGIKPIAFVLAMLVGMYIYKLLRKN